MRLRRWDKGIGRGAGRIDQIGSAVRHNRRDETSRGGAAFVRGAAPDQRRGRDSNPR